MMGGYAVTITTTGLSIPTTAKSVFANDREEKWGRFNKTNKQQQLEEAPAAGSISVIRRSGS
jgi:hypothetical protein